MHRRRIGPGSQLVADVHRHIRRRGLSYVCSRTVELDEPPWAVGEALARLADQGALEKHRERNAPDLYRVTA